MSYALTYKPWEKVNVIFFIISDISLETILNW